MTIAAIRRRLVDTVEQLRDEILDDLKDALTGDEPIHVMVEVPGEAEPLLCMRTEGYFRLVLDEFGLDRGCERLQETVYEWVRRDIDEVLGAGGP